ncbi:hypothetical protein HS088_TW03G00327 [Tripterygium wilfordii]|uniref:Uncharacterized protein n=1 Tax=Tripterygium wilfordii TaxID=458696 RepID=A0A7J7DUE6_TRIWF|nr:hypothetical protein HS088_TW03G00327 [Tripterygium wilfordii]
MVRIMKVSTKNVADFIAQKLAVKMITRPKEMMEEKILMTKVLQMNIINCLLMLNLLASEKMQKKIFRGLYQTCQAMKRWEMRKSFLTHQFLFIVSVTYTRNCFYMRKGW